MNEPRFSNYFFEKRGSSFIQSAAISRLQESRRISGIFLNFIEKQDSFSAFVRRQQSLVFQGAGQILPEQL